MWCPRCGSDNADFVDEEFDGESYSIKGWCPECHDDFIEMYSVEFVEYTDRHYNTIEPIDKEEEHV